MKIISTSKLPNSRIPIVIIGAGGIVKDAHLPAYEKAGFKVVGIYDLHTETAAQLGWQFAIPNVLPTLEELIALAARQRAIFDIAVPASAIIGILTQLPRGSAALIQKPMGEHLPQAKEILAICRDRGLTAAINFQLRFAPFVNAARSIIEAGAIGQLYDLEIKVCTFTPWHLWDFLAKIPRVEILYHSIHYLDLVRSFLGDPRRTMARTVRHPDTSVASTRSTVIMDYGDLQSATIQTNHDHNFGPNHQQSYIKWEGTRGAIYAKMGLNLNYPDGVPDVFEYIVRDDAKDPVWQTVNIEGSWFPDAFIGTISSLMRYVEGSENELPTSVEDAIKTMEAVEEAYVCSESTKTAINGVSKS